ncbi:MAG: riboflavin synthase [Rhodobacteraceae bacterium]|nr:riboflavin synthase [Paracoccaceae bacterium]
MFTGIITDVGEIIELEKRGDLRARIKTNYDTKGIAFGASIACDGVCLTAVDFGDNWFDVEISAETVSKTIIGSGLWEINYKVNLERSLKVGDELGGHIVSGHVDGIATVSSIVDEGDSTRFTFEVPMKLARFIAPKGSVALNGTSLTVNEVKDNVFGINLVPHTKKVTSWNKTQVGDPVNLEIDTLARFVARLADYQ